MANYNIRSSGGKSGVKEGHRAVLRVAPRKLGESVPQSWSTSNRALWRNVGQSISERRFMTTLLARQHRSTGSVFCAPKWLMALTKRETQRTPWGLPPDSADSEPLALTGSYPAPADHRVGRIFLSGSAGCRTHSTRHGTPRHHKLYGRQGMHLCCAPVLFGRRFLDRSDLNSAQRDTP
jgi:hypothetical protein